MKLTAKLVSVLMVGIIILNVSNGFLALQREAQLFEQDTRGDAQRLGSAMETMILTVWQQNGRERALELIRQASGQQYRMRVRWVWFDVELDIYGARLQVIY